MTPKEFLDQFGPEATKVFQKTKCLYASVVLSQLIQELGWNVQTCKDINTGKESYNLFNIKGSTPQAGSVQSWTWEEDANGLETKMICEFRAYNNYAESFEDHSNLLLKLDRYEPVRSAKSPEDQCRALQSCGYATDINYAKSLINIINQFDLKKYDVLKEEPKMLSSKHFIDIPENMKWIMDAADRMFEEKIVLGDGAGHLNPTAPITRGEMVVLIDRLFTALKK